TIYRIQIPDHLCERTPHFDSIWLSKQVLRKEEMTSSMTVTCCCCKKMVHLEASYLEDMPVLAGWVSIDRKAFCRDCVAHFTEEDWDWCPEPPVSLNLAEIARLRLGDVEPL